MLAEWIAEFCQDHGPHCAVKRPGQPATVAATRASLLLAQESTLGRLDRLGYQGHPQSPRRTGPKSGRASGRGEQCRMLRFTEQA